MRFQNHYWHCDQEWIDVWSCMCNDRCPVCNKEIEPFDSREIEVDSPTGEEEWSTALEKPSASCVPSPQTSLHSLCDALHTLAEHLPIDATWAFVADYARNRAAAAKREGS